MEMTHMQEGEPGDSKEQHRPRRPASVQEGGARLPSSSGLRAPVVMSSMARSPMAKSYTTARPEASMHIPVSHAEAREHNNVSGFNRQILVQKLAKLNISQQSIETVSHWCVFHHRYCRQVVETWDGEFHPATCERRVSLLYLANDIMQNSRKEGSGYITEFMKVIPAALDEVFLNGDDFGRNVVKRLVDIWEDRKIFDTQGQSFRDDFFRRLKDLRSKLKKPGGELLEKVISSYKHMMNAPIDEDTLMRKCQATLSNFDNLNKAYGNDSYSGRSNGSGFMEELQEQHGILRNSIEQLKMSESLRTTLISHLKEALNEQEFKMEKVRSQLEAAQSRYKNADELCQELGVEVEWHQPSNRVPATVASDSANAGSLQNGQSAVMYSQVGDGGKQNAAAANVATELATDAASDDTLSDVSSSRANGSNLARQSGGHSLGNKRQKLEDDAYISQPHSQPPPPPPFPHPDTFQPPPPEYPPSPEPSPPPLPKSLPPQIIPPPPETSMPPQLISPLPPTAGTSVPFPAGMPYCTFPSYTPVVNFPMINMPPGFPGAPNPPPAFQGFGGTLYGSPPFPTAPPTMDEK